MCPVSGEGTAICLPLRFAPDILTVRRCTRRVAEAVGLPYSGQTRLATAVSEVARCALLEHGGAIDFALEPKRSPAVLVVTVTSDVVPGAPRRGHPPEDAPPNSLQAAAALQLTRRLVDDLVELPLNARGHVVALKMRLSHGPKDAADELARLTREMAELGRDDPLEEIEQQNQEVIGLLDELDERRDQLARLNAELQQTDDGLVALYSELMDANAVISGLAATDPLTGIANRRRFSESLATAGALAKRYGHPWALASFDLDGLKRVNDCFGHPQGDAILTSFATLLSSMCREADLPARVGGDEFSVVLPGIGEGEARAFAKRVLAAARLCAELQQCGITVSGGIAAGAPAEPPTDVLRRADEALYAAKRSGGDTVAEGDCA